MRIKKRDGSLQPVDLNKISNRIKFLVEGLDPDGVRIGPQLSIDPDEISKVVVSQINDGVSSQELDEFAARSCAYRSGDHPDYGALAARIIISNHHKNTAKYAKFSDMVQVLYDNRDSLGAPAPLVAHRFYQVATDPTNSQLLDQAVQERHNRDYKILDYFGLKTLERSYLLRNRSVKPQVQERYQHLLMRVALATYLDDIPAAIECYQKLSDGLFTHASPTMFNSGTPRPQLSSCFLLGMDDSIEGMYETVRRMAHISKWAGGLGLHLSKIRAQGSLIRGTNGNSDGNVPLAKVINDFARHVNQGGKRKGAVALYLEPWHADVFDFLELKTPHGNQERRAHDLFYAMYIPDIFMRRVSRALSLKRVTGKSGVMWSLMCPDQCPGLADTYGQEFDRIYTEYEREGRFKRQVDITTLWQAILDSQKETGSPYMLYKDSINRKSNQKNIGVIRSSNLCVAGDTRILTNKGELPIKDLEGLDVKVWNGEQFSQTRVLRTGRDQEMVRIKFSNGSEIRCTPYHKFYIDAGPNTVNTVEAHALKYGTKLADFKLPDSNKVHRVVVVSVEKLDHKEDTWCFNESLRHAGIFNGILAGNCTEIVEFSDHEEIAVCNLASINLKKMVDLPTASSPKFNHQRLYSVTKQVTRNLNRIIDLNYYPVPETRRSNFRHRPIGIGVQGLADAFFLLRIPFESPEAQQLNQEIFETIYFAALEQSMESAMERTQVLSQVPIKTLAQLRDACSMIEHHQNYLTDLKLKARKNLSRAEARIKSQTQTHLEQLQRDTSQIIQKYGLNPTVYEYQYLDLENPDSRARLGAYSTFCGSPAHQGQLQPDLWGVKPSGRWNFERLRRQVQEHGLRNSLLIAPMPTASTAQILGNNECFEPVTTNIYARQVHSGTFIIVNRYLQQDLLDLGLWDSHMKERIMLSKGSVQKIPEIPAHLKILYKTVWEMSKKTLINMAADRGAFIDQSQSFNYFIEDPNDAILTSCHMHGWKRGLKTGMYYLRRRTVANAQQFSIDMTKHADKKNTTNDDHRVENLDLSDQQKSNLKSPKFICTMDDPTCLSCGA